MRPHAHVPGETQVIGYRLQGTGLLLVDGTNESDHQVIRSSGHRVIGSSEEAQQILSLIGKTVKVSQSSAQNLIYP